jgi:hypothetical protein
MNIIQGLPHFFMRPPTDTELDELPHVILTSDLDWDPDSLDNVIDPNDSDWYPYEPFEDPYGSHSFYHRGTFQHRDFHLLLASSPPSITVSTTTMVDQEPDFESLRPKFGWCPTEIIKHTFANTTQFAHSVTLYGDMRKHYKSRFPAFNVARRSEPVVTDTIYADTAAIDNGSRCAQIFVCRES